MPLNVLVTGATGQQGGAVSRHLIQQGHKIHAITRNPDSPAAQQLAAAGAKVHRADFSNPETLRRASQGIDVAYVMTTPFEAGPDKEQEQGIHAIDALSNVRHIVLTSVASADQNTGIPHFDSKNAVEQHLQSTGIDHTIIAPVFFMENFISPWLASALQHGQLVMPLPPERKLQMISINDLGYMSANIIQHSSKYRNQRIELATEDITGPEAAKAISAATGRDIKYVIQPLEQMMSTNRDFGLMYDWFNRVGYTVNIPPLRQQFPQAPWLNIQQWAKQQDWQAVLQHVQAGA